MQVIVLAEDATMSETTMMTGVATVTLPDGRVFKEQGRLVLTRGKSRMTGAGLVHCNVDCPPGTVVEVRIHEHSVQALITEVDLRSSRFVVHLRV